MALAMPFTPTSSLNEASRVVCDKLQRGTSECSDARWQLRAAQAQIGQNHLGRADDKAKCMGLVFVNGF